MVDNVIGGGQADKKSARYSVRETYEQDSHTARQGDREIDRHQGGSQLDKQKLGISRQSTGPGSCTLSKRF